MPVAIADADLSIANLLQGAAIEKFDDEIQKVADNIMDPNTDPEAVRTVTLVMRVRPGKSRETATVSVQASSKLAQPRPVPTTVVLARTANGTAITELVSKQQPLFTDANKQPVPPPPAHIDRAREAHEDNET